MIFFFDNRGIRDFALTNPQDPCKAPLPHGSSKSRTCGPRAWPKGIVCTQRESNLRSNASWDTKSKRLTTEPTLWGSFEAWVADTATTWFHFAFNFFFSLFLCNWKVAHDNLPCGAHWTRGSFLLGRRAHASTMEYAAVDFKRCCSATCGALWLVANIIQIFNHFFRLVDDRFALLESKFPILSILTGFSYTNEKINYLEG